MLQASDEEELAWPVYKGESFELDVADTGEYYGFALPNVMGRWLQSARQRRVAGSAYSEFSSEWARDPHAAPWLSSRVAFRDVARATDTRTVIPCVVPPNVFLTDKAPYFLFCRGDVRDQAFLYGVLRSIPFDWFARRYIETGVKFYLINTFPIPRPSRDDICWKRIVTLAGRLACPDERFATWGKAIGAKCGPIEEGKKTDMIHELDAVVSHLYGLSEAQLVHVFETFHEGWNFSDRLSGVLRHYRNWAQKY